MEIKKCISKFLESNTFIVEKEGQALIIDAGVDVDTVSRNLNGKVVGILLTHGHYDHAFYIQDYIKKFNCPVYMSSYANEVLADPGLNYGEGFSIKIENTMEMTDDKQIKCGVFDINTFITKGHSICSVSYLIDDELFVGDTVFEIGVGRTDLKTGDEKEMLESLIKLDSLNFKNLHSGHGKDSTREQQNRNLKTYIRFLGRNKK